MQVFEFHFNPKLKPDLIFDSFCYEPANIYEKRLGSLYMVGLLKNVLPQNIRFLEKLSKVIKNRHYRSTIFSPEKSLKESLREANKFLEEIAKKGDVSWLGNLSFTALSLKDFKLNFTKVGEAKIFLLRAGKIIDIDKKLRLEDIEPYPLKVFGNIVSGKLAEDDLILVLTKEIFDFFQEKNILDEIAKLTSFSEKELKEILNGKREDLSKISGVCLAIFLTKEAPLGKRETISPKILKEFSLKEVFSPALKFFKKIKKPQLRPSALAKASADKVSKRVKSLKLPKIKAPKLPVVEVFRARIKPLVLNKKIVLIGSLIIILALGFIFSQIEEKQKIRVYQSNLEKIQEKINLAESLLILEETNPQTTQKANLLLKESWEEISPILKEAKNLPKSFSSQIFALEDRISKNLYQLNKLIEIQTPEIIFEFEPKKFVPQKMIFSANKLYFFSPYSKNLFLLKESGKGEIIKIGQKINLATRLNDKILFFSKPSQLTILNGREQFSAILKEPPSDFSFDNLSSFKRNLYFFDKKSGQIIKYPCQRDFEWKKPEFWLKKATEGKSMSVDGSIWILKKNNTIERYYTGSLQEKIELDIFPPVKDFSKVFTSPTLSHLFVLEPVQKRIIILNKKGEIIKQFQSEKFDNLLDFGVSEDGKIIWLLNGLKVYKVEL